MSRPRLTSGAFPSEPYESFQLGCKRARRPVGLSGWRLPKLNLRLTWSRRKTQSRKSPLAGVGDLRPVDQLLLLRRVLYTAGEGFNPLKGHAVNLGAQAGRIDVFHARNRAEVGTWIKTPSAKPEGGIDAPLAWTSGAWDMAQPCETRAFAPTHRPAPHCMGQDAPAPQHRWTRPAPNQKPRRSAGLSLRFKPRLARRSLGVGRQRSKMTPTTIWLRSLPARPEGGSVRCELATRL